MFERWRRFEFSSRPCSNAPEPHGLVERITDAQADLIVTLDEGQFSDVKALDIEPAKLTKALAALANSDGGDLYIGIDEERTTKVRTWRGFSNQEAANGHL
jgi:ATP-dependent DNA helicase RecG